LTGYSPEQLIKMNMMELIAPEYHAERAERLQQRIDGKVNNSIYTLEVVHKDGHRLWVELANSPVWNDEGQLVAVLGVGRDLT